MYHFCDLKSKLNDNLIENRNFYCFTVKIPITTDTYYQILLK